MQGNLDIGVLLPILEKIQSECKHRFLDIGYTTRFYTHHPADTDKDLIETGEYFYEQFKMHFKNLEQYEADTRKINQVIGTIDKLALKYLD
jgi:hypothetical protein